MGKTRKVGYILFCMFCEYYCQSLISGRDIQLRLKIEIFLTFPNFVILSYKLFGNS